MANRVISYVFKGDFSNLNTGTVGATRNSRELSTSLKDVDAQGGKTAKTLGVIGASAASAGAIIGVGLVASAEKATMAFDKSMSAVQAATHATAAEMADFSQAALTAGKTTAFSATEAASAIEELAKAGVSTKDIIGGGLTGALNLAAAGAVDVGEAAEVAASAMTQFKLQGDQVGHIADLLSAGAGKAQGSVHDLGMALNQSGLVASQTGLSIEETTGTLAAFASAGLIGSDAGTSFKTMLQALTPNSKQASDTMKRLGISAYDARGGFIGMTKFAANLRGALQGLSTEQQNAALKTIFGSDAVRAASVIYSQGADGIQTWIDKTNDAGYAAETASLRLDNLSGDLQKLKGAIDAAFIQGGEDSQSSLRTLTQTLTEFVNLGNTEIPKVGTSIQGLGQKFVNTASGLDLAKTSLDFWGQKLGFSKDETEKAKDSTDDYTSALSSVGTTAVDAGQDIDSLVKSMKDQRDAAVSAFDAVTQYAQALAEARKRGKESNKGIDASTKAGRENRDALSKLASAWNNQSDAVRNSQNGLRKARADFIATATAMGVPIEQAKRLAKSLLNLPDRTVVTVDANTDPAASAIASIKRQLSSVPRSVRTDFYVNQINGINKRGATKQATGGYITGPGSATSDSIPAYLSNGEYVVRASAVAKYGVAMFDSLNAQRFAGGGMAGGYSKRHAPSASSWMTDGVTDIRDFLHGVKLSAASLHQLKGAVERSKNALDNEKQARDSLKQAKSSYASDVSSSFTHDIFGNGASGVLTQLNADTNDANAMKKALAGAAAHGLNVRGGLYGQLAASGDLNTAQQLAHMSRAQIDRLEAAFQARQNATGSLGAVASGNQFNAQIARRDKTIEQLEKVLRTLEHSVENGARKGTADGMKGRDKVTSTRTRGK